MTSYINALEKYFEINLGVKMARIGVNRSNKK